MNDNEPTMLFGRPLSTMMAVIGTAVVFSQIFTLIFIVNIWFYFLYIMLAAVMLYVLSIGIKKKKTGPISAYSVFLLCYVMFVTTFSVWLSVDWIIEMSWPLVAIPDDSSTPVPHTRQAPKSDYIVALIVVLVTSAISVLLSIYQLRLCLLFARFCRSTGSDNFNVSYQTRFAARPWGNMPTGPANNQQAGPLPDKPPSYADVTSTPVTVEQPTSLAQSSVVLQTTLENTQTTANMPLQQAANPIHDDLDTILGRDRPPVIQTGSIMGGVFEAHSPTQPIENILLQQNANISVFSDPFDPEEETTTVADTLAVSDVAVESGHGFIPSATNPFAAEFSAEYSNTTNSEITTETRELGLFEDIHLN